MEHLAGRHAVVVDAAVEVDRLYRQPTERGVVAGEERSEHRGVEGAHDAARGVRCRAVLVGDGGRCTAEQRVERRVEQADVVVLLDQRGAQAVAHEIVIADVDHPERLCRVDHLAGGHLEARRTQPLGEEHDAFDHRACSGSESSSISAPIA